MITDLFKIKKFKKEIFELTEQLKNQNKIHNDELNKANLKIKELKKKLKKCEYDEVYNYEKHDVDSDKFCTHEFQMQFLSYIDNNTEGVKEKFNELIYKEKLFLNGIACCLDFIQTKRNKKLSTEKQLRKYILTNYGRECIDKYINDIYER